MPSKPKAFSLLVSPARLILGQDDVGSTQRISVVNQGDAPLAVAVQKHDFVAGRDGTLKYQDNTPYAASDWISLSKTELDIAPGATAIVEARVTTPPTYEPGDHQVAVAFSVAAGVTKGNIRIDRAIAMPVFITAPGPVVDSVALRDLKAPGFVMSGPVNIVATVANIGTVHHDFRAPSPLTVQAAGTAPPFPDFTVPRDSVRDVATTWQPPLMCVCHPTVSLTSAAGGVQTKTIRVIVFPWPWFAAGLGLVLLVLLSVRVGRRRYAAHVEQAAARQTAAAVQTEA